MWKTRTDRATHNAPSSQPQLATPITANTNTLRRQPVDSGLAAHSSVRNHRSATRASAATAAETTIDPNLVTCPHSPATGTILSAAWLGVGGGRFASLFLSTCYSMRWPLFTIACMLAIIWSEGA